MHLLKLSIKNYRVIKNVTIALPDKVIGIIGPNGAGKSSIIEAIAWALYGNVAARSAKNEIKSTYAGASATVEVDLEFMIRGEHFRVIRRLVGKTEKPEVILYRGTASESVGSTETQKHIASLLGLDWRGFLTSFLARQQELNALSDLPAGKRREHLAGMLGIDRLDKAIQLIKSDTKLAGEHSIILTQRLSEREHITVRIKELSANLEKLILTKSQKLNEWEKSKIKLDLSNRKFTQAQTDKDRCSQLMAKLDVEQNSINILNQQLQQFDREHETMLRNEQAVANLEKTLTHYDNTKEEYRREHEAAQSKKLINEIDEQLAKSKSDLERSVNSRTIAEKNRKELLEKLNNIPIDLDQLSITKTEELEKAREKYSLERSNYDIASRDHKKISNQLSGISELGPDAVCDRCHRAYGNDLIEIKKHLKDELSEIQINLDNLSQLKKEIKADGEKIKSELTKLEKLSKSRDELNSQTGTLDSEIKRLNNDEILTKKRLDEYLAKLSKLDRITSDPEKLKSLKITLEKMEANRRDMDILIGQLSRKDDLIKQLNDASENKKQTEIRHFELKAQINKLNFDQTDFDNLKKEYQEALQNTEAMNTGVAQAAKELEIVENELKLRSEQIDQFTKVEADLEKIRSSHYYGEKLSTLISDFRKYLIASIRPRLAELSTTLFTEMTADKYGAVELDEDYNIQIMDNLQMYGIDRYSGGEKDLANLCLRLAISIALTESAGLDRSFVILDEVFGSQDAGRRELIFQGLANLKQRFPQVFLITHIDEIKNSVETLIEVNPTSTWSEIRIGGILAS